MNGKVTHIAFADESDYNKGPFPSIGMVSLPLGLADKLRSKLRQQLDKFNIHEFQWKKLDGRKQKHAAFKMIDAVMPYLLHRQIRIDVLTWDISDSRHDILRRNDIANLQRMYFHLTTHVFRRCWPDDAVWVLHPDEQTAMHWNELQRFVQYLEFDIDVIPKTLFNHEFSAILKHVFQLQAIQPLTSDNEVLIQLADLFAGLSHFSRRRFNNYQNNARPHLEKQMSLELDGPQPTLDDLSNSERERQEVLHKIVTAVKESGLGVSFQSSGMLKTIKGRSTWSDRPLNFWWYEPQGDYDKAPTKSKKGKTIGNRQ